MIELFTIKKEVFRPFIDLMANFHRDVEFKLLDNVELCFYDTTGSAQIHAVLNVVPLEKTLFKIDLNEIGSIVAKGDVKIFAHDNQIDAHVTGGLKYKSVKLADCINTRSSEPKVLEDFTAKFKFEQGDLANFLDMLKNVKAGKDSSNCIGLELKEGVARIFDHKKTIECPINGDSEGTDSISHYAVDYFIDIFSFYKSFTTVTIEFGENYPCHIEMNSPDLIFNILVAPRNLVDD